MGIIKKVKSFFTKGDNSIEKYEMSEEEKAATKDQLEVDKNKRIKDQENDEEEIDQYIKDAGRRISR
ncbi:MAG: hypothetical protein QW331_04235 [Candidatus Woesearchaeota archaeon]